MSTPLSTALQPSPLVVAFLRTAARTEGLPCRRNPARWSSDLPDEQEAAARMCLTCALLELCRETYLAEPSAWSGVVLGGYTTSPPRALGATERRREAGMPMTLPAARRSRDAATLNARRVAQRQPKPQPTPAEQRAALDTAVLYARGRWRNGADHPGIPDEETERRRLAYVASLQARDTFHEENPSAHRYRRSSTVRPRALPRAQRQQTGADAVQEGCAS